MAIVTTSEMFKKAYEGHYAIGAFNVNNMEIIQGITEAAKEENAPLILQVSAGARKYAKHVYLMKMIEAAVADTDLPIAVHLDHGPDFETCKSCIDGGFSSVMIDKSGLPFEENIRETRRVVEYAHDHGVVVEAELGTLAGVEDDVKVAAEDSSYTRPEEVEEFVTRTGCDSLAIARSFPPSAWLPDRSAWCILCASGIREDYQRAWRKDAGCCWCSGRTAGICTCIHR